jgi:hypothetical protein
MMQRQIRLKLPHSLRRTKPQQSTITLDNIGETYRCQLRPPARPRRLWLGLAWVFCVLRRVFRHTENPCFVGILRVPPITGIACCCARAASGHARTAEQRDEFSPVHSITSSARASRLSTSTV